METIIDKQETFGILLSLLSVFSIFAVSLPFAAYAQTSAPLQVGDSADLQSRLRAIKETVEKRRAEPGTPGVSLVIVKGGEIIYLKDSDYFQDVRPGNRENITIRVDSLQEI